MENFAFKILEYMNIIMVIFGIINSYPEVKIFNINCYKQNNDYYISFETKNLINNFLSQIINDGIEVDLNFKVSSYYDILFNNDKIYYDKVVVKIQKISNYIFINDDIKINSEELTNYFNKKINLKILSNVSEYKGKKVRSEIEFLLDSPISSEITTLWGNKPKIIINYTVR